MPPPYCTCDRLDRILGFASATCPMHGLEQPGLTLTALAEGCEAEALNARRDARCFFLLAGLSVLAVLVALAVAGSNVEGPPLIGVAAFAGLNFGIGRARNRNVGQLERAALLGRTVAGQ